MTIGTNLKNHFFLPVPPHVTVHGETKAKNNQRRGTITKDKGNRDARHNKKRNMTMILPQPTTDEKDADYR